MSDFLNKYPYTDFHELNLDWVIERVKKLTEDWAATLEEWNSTEEQWQELYDYVHDYFDNLDVQQEVNNKINAMIADGTFVTITTPVIEAKVASMTPGIVTANLPGVVADQIGSVVASQIDASVAGQIATPAATAAAAWLADHITQPTTPAIDTSLTVGGAAADSETVGNALYNQYSSSSTYNRGDYVLYNGIIYKCITAISTPEAWNSLHWNACTVYGQISNIENMNAGINNLFTISDMSKGAIVDESTFVNPTMTSSNEFKYIRFTEFLTDDSPFINVNVGANHLLAILLFFDSDGHITWQSGSWIEITSGTFNYLKKSVADIYNATTFTATIAVSTSTNISDRIDIPGGTIFSTYYYDYTTIIKHIKYLESGTGNLAIVGGNSIYQTVQSAIDATSDGDTILILPGTYNEAVKMFTKNRNLIGLNRDSCIIYSGSGLYDDPALEANIGSIRNLTIISGNDNGLTEDSPIAKAYGIHIEYGNATEYSLHIDNCVIKSALHAAIGMGVRWNQHIEISNCYIETECTQTYSYAILDFINSAPILFHNDSSAVHPGSDGTLHISKCELVGKSTVVMVRSVENGNIMTVRFDRNLGYYTNVSGQVIDYWGSPVPIDPDHFAGSDILFDHNSFGNNQAALNY